MVVRYLQSVELSAQENGRKGGCEEAEEIWVEKKKYVRELAHAQS
jgi:hypothetical protein